MTDVLRNLKIGFIGSGAMAEAMLRGLAESGAVLSAADPAAARREKAAAYGAEATDDNRQAAAAADLVVLAVKPQTAEGVLAEVGPILKPHQTLLSIVAGLRLKTIRTAAPAPRLIRAMPNAPALIGAGITGAAVEGPDTKAEALAAAVLAPLGRVVFVPETLLDAVTGLSGSGPAYAALFVEALIEGGVKAGLPRAIAVDLAVETMLGAARLLAGGESPASLRERVTSPGGTTACGLFALERGGVRAAVIEAVTAAAARAAELGGDEKRRDGA